MQVRSKNEVFEEKRLFWFCMIVESDRRKFVTRMEGGLANSGFGRG